MPKSLVAALALVSAAAGSGAAALILSGTTKTVVAQSENTFYTGRVFRDGGLEFANRSCGRVLGSDGGIVAEPCREGTLSVAESKCAMDYFQCVVLPRVKAEASK